MTRRKKHQPTPESPVEIDPSTEIDAALPMQNSVLPAEDAPAPPPAPKKPRGKKAGSPAPEADPAPAAGEETSATPETIQELVQAAATVVKRRRARKAAETEEERDAAALERARAMFATETEPEAETPADEVPEERAETTTDEDDVDTPRARSLDDVEKTVNLVGDQLPLPGRDDLDAPTLTVMAEALDEVDEVIDQRRHLRGLLEALVFASDVPVKTSDLVTVAAVAFRAVKDALDELVVDYTERGIHLEEVNGGWVFRTSSKFAPFVRDLTKQRPIRLSRAQVEALAIIAYRQPITRPEIDDVRGVDSGPVLKVLLERDLIRILGKRDEVGRPLIYGTTNVFLEFFGLKSLKDLPTLREFTELTEESRDTYEEEMGEAPNDLAALDENADTSGAAEAGEVPSDDEDDDDDD